ncbi:MAG: metal-dependent hydrolase [Pseudomonadota bacterium]
MDSLTQFTLGAAISTVCLGRKLGPRKAALLGGLLGTLPDLDVFLPVGDPVDAFVLHRGWTHSLFVHAVLAPVFGEALVRTIGALRDSRLRVWLAVFLVFSTHALIDAITVYGTRLFWPFYPEPIGVGSMFIIDPLYTLPLLIPVIWAFFKRDWSRRLAGVLAATLVFTTAYMGLSLVLQAHAERRAASIFADAGIEARNIFAISGPLNTVVWKVIGQEDDRYHNLYLSLLDGDRAPRIYTHASRPDLTACLNGNPAFEKLAWFSRGYFRASLEDGRIVVSDLRMGLTPGYVFRFAVARYDGESATPIPPEQIRGRLATVGDDLAWLRARFMGRPAVRAAEVGGTRPGDEDVDGGLARCE